MDTPDLLLTCRLCMGPEQSVSLFSEYQNLVRYGDVVTNLILIELESHPVLPSMICMECTSKLILFHKFRIKCIETNQLFEEYIRSEEQFNSDEKPDDWTDADRQEDNFLEDEALKAEQEEDADSTSINANETLDSIETFLTDIETGRQDEEHEDRHDAGVYIDTNNQPLPEEEEYLEESCLASLCSTEDSVKVDNFANNASFDVNQCSDVDDANDHNYQIQDDAIYVKYSEILLSTVDDDDEKRSQFEIEFNEDVVVLETETIPVPKTLIRVGSNYTQSGAFKCTQCDQEFSRKSSLAQHWKTRHLGIKDFTCDICAQHFTRKTHVIFHMRIHQNDRPHICSVCSKSFVKLSDLARHRLIHSDERNFECKECQKRFKRPADVVTHMLTHTGHKPYRCQVDPACNKSYTSHSSLKKHMLRIHSA